MSYEPESSRGRYHRPPTPPPPNKPVPFTPIVPPEITGQAPASAPSACTLPLLDTLYAGNRIWAERPVVPPRVSMIDSFLARMDKHYHVLAESVMSRIPEVQDFASFAGRGASNEYEFGLAAEAVVRRLTACTDIPQTERRYVRSGARVMSHREIRKPPTQGQEPVGGKLGLGTSYCTSRVQWYPESWTLGPLSLSTVVHGVGGCANPPPLSPSVITNIGLFKWEDVQLLWELKSSSRHINSPAVLSDLVLKAIEVLHAQWDRRFVLAFLICGAEMKMFRFDRSGVFISSTVDIREGGGMTLVKCILAGLVLPAPDLGFPRELEDPLTVPVDGVPRPVVTVDRQIFVLGSEIVSSSRQHLVGRGTVVHLARNLYGTAWDACYKTGWPNITRPPEGHILEDLQGVEGVVELFAWDAPLVEGMLSTEEIYRDFEVQVIAGDKNTSNRQYSFHPREFRQTVTAYLPAPGLPPTALTLLYAWRSLYLVVDDIVQRGWVHRDLSWNNVRIMRHHDEPSNLNLRDPVSVTLIDFDLASPILGPVPKTSDRTGTAPFMPLQVLCSTKRTRHQELHEDEAAFWIGFLAILSRTQIGYQQVSTLSDPKLSLEDVADKKIRMISLVGRRLLWKKWFGTGAEGDELRRICMKVLQVQFGRLDMVYPPPDATDEHGNRKQEILHGQVVRKVVQVLEEGIERLQGRA
jgi:Fungal protein kinase